MSRVYKVRTNGVNVARVGGVAVSRADRLALIVLWSAATAVGVGAGWYIALGTANWYLAGVPLGVCQGLVLLPQWDRAVRWVLATSVGWIIGFALMAGLGVLVEGYIPAYWWVTDRGINVGWAIALLPFVGVPAVALAQWFAMKRWTNREGWLFWFGVSVCSFVVAGFIGLVNLDPRQSPGEFGPPFVQALAPGPWLVGALWGICTGGALWKMPEIALADDGTGARQDITSKANMVALTVVGIGLALMIVNHLLNFLLIFIHYGQLIYADDFHVPPYWLSIPMFLALGYSLARGPNASQAIWLGLCVILVDLMIDWASVLPLLVNNPFSYTPDLGGFEAPALTWSYMLGLSLQHLVMWGFSLGLGISLKRLWDKQGQSAF